MLTNVNTLLVDAATVAASETSSAARVGYVKDINAVASITAANPSNIAFTADEATDTCTTATAHGAVTGVKVQFTTTDTLPAGLSTSTDYYLIVLSTTTFKVATSQANAAAGTAVDITDAGTGTHTVAFVATIAGTAKLQVNLEPTNKTGVWVDVTDAEVTNANNSQSFSGTGTVRWALANFGGEELRAVITVTSGTVTASVRLAGKG